MDKLQSIWTQLNQLSAELGEMAEPKSISSVYEQLQREQDLRKKFNPLLIAFVLLFPVVLWQVLPTATENGTKWLGILLVASAGIAIAVFSQIVKMPLKQFAYDRSSTEFLSIVRAKLDQSRKMLILGICLQITLLTLGLFFLIFGSIPEEGFYGFLGLFLGFMFGLGGLAVGGSIASFNRYYRDLYQRIDRFLAD